MKKFLFAFILLPLFSNAQNSPQRAKLEMNACYEQSLRLFIQTHPEAIEKSTLAPGKVLFVKRNEEYTKGLKDTLAGVMIQQIDPAKDLETIGKHIPKKAKITIVDLQKMMQRDLNAYIWVLPMKAAFNHKKNKLTEPTYENKLCEYVFDYTPERNQYFLYKESSCKDL